MSHPSLMRLLGGACVALTLCFMAATVEAQRGRGGGGRGGGGRGGGGGRSISRSGPAAGGSFRTSGGSSRSRASTYGGSSATQRPSTQPSTRPSTQPSTRPSTQPGASTRPSTGQTRPGTGTGENRPSQRPGEGNLGDNANREDWQQHADQAREDRQNNQAQAREDWQDFYEESGGGYYYGGYYGYPYGYPHTTVVITSMQFSSMQSETQCTLSEVSVNGVRYYKCGSTWYNRVIDGTNVNYVVVSAPPGY